MDFKKKQKGRASNRILFKAGGILLLLVFLGLLVADYRIYKKKQILLSQVELYQKQIEDIKNRNETLGAQIENSDNLEYIEKVAREQQNMQKPGESVVTFLAQEQPQKPGEKPKSFWVNFTGWLSGLLRD